LGGVVTVGGTGIVGVEVELHGGNVVCGTVTRFPSGVCQTVPPGTNSTLKLPSGRPAGSCTLWPRWMPQLAAVERGTTQSVTASDPAERTKRLSRLDIAAPSVPGQTRVNSSFPSRDPLSIVANFYAGSRRAVNSDLRVLRTGDTSFRPIPVRRSELAS